jgi:hypothetical protein
MVFSIMMFPFEANPVRFIRELAGGQVGDQPQPVTNNAGTQRRLA